MFICHGSQDKDRVRQLVKTIRRANIEPWLDEEKLIPGQDWQMEIARAIREAHAVVVCLSRATCSKADYVQQEIRHALEVAYQQPEGAVFVIPAKLEECDIPEKLQKWQWVMLDASEGITRLIAALEARAKALGLRV